MATVNDQAGKGVLDRLSEREKMQLGGLGLFLTVIACIIGVALFHRSMEDISRATSRYEAALDYLALSAPAYVERSSAKSQEGTHKNVDDESLTKNNIKLTSFVAEQAEKASIEVSSYDESELPFGNKKDGGPIVIEKQLKVDIRKAPMDKLMDLLDRIHKSPEPVFVKRLDIRVRRKTPGEVRALVTVATYLKKDPEAP